MTTAQGQPSLFVNNIVKQREGGLHNEPHMQQMQPCGGGGFAANTTTKVVCPRAITMQEDIERQQLGQLMDPSTPAGKFLRDLGITMEDARQLGIVSLLQNLPRKERTKYGKRKKLSNDEKKVLTKERNREHARSTRTRKKMILDALESRLAEINRDSFLTTITPKPNPALEKSLENKRLCCIRQLLSLCSNATGGSSGSSNNISEHRHYSYNECNGITIWDKCITSDTHQLPFRLTFPALPQQLVDDSTSVLEGFGTQGSINACSLIGKSFSDIIEVATRTLGKEEEEEEEDCLNMRSDKGGAANGYEDNKASAGGGGSSSLINCSIQFTAVPGSVLQAKNRCMLHVRVELGLCLMSSVTPSIVSVLGMARSVFVPGQKYLSEFHIRWDMIALCSQIANLLPKQHSGKLAAAISGTTSLSTPLIQQ